MRRTLSLGLLPAVIAVLLSGTACGRRGISRTTPCPPVAQATQTWAPPAGGSPTTEAPSPTSQPTRGLPTVSPASPTADVEADQIEQLLGDLESAVESGDDFPDLP